MLEKKELSWWKRVLFHCFRSTRSALALAHTAIVIAFLVSGVLQLLGVDPERAECTASVAFVAWMCILLVAVEVWSQLSEQL